MTLKHPHDALIRDWLDGRVIQYRPAGSDEPWYDMGGPGKAVKLPHFYTDGKTEYRRKPVTVRYRVALHSDGVNYWTETVNTVEQERNMRTPERWLTDWTEVEV